VTERPNSDVGKVRVTWCHPPHRVDPMFLNSIVRSQADDLQGRHLVGQWYGVESGPRIAVTRNKLVRDWLDESDCEWLLMVDSDMVFGPQAIPAMFDIAVHRGLKLLGGLCFSVDNDGDQQSTALVLDPSQKRDGVDVLAPYETVHGDLPKGALLEVAATGAAFLLIHRSLAVKIRRMNGDTAQQPKPFVWFAEAAAGSGELGEDVFFCMQARAVAAEKQDTSWLPYVATTIPVGHRKPVVFDASTWEEQQRAKAVAELLAERPDLVGDVECQQQVVTA